MSRRLVLQSQAADDLAEATAWYDRQRAGLGAEFTDKVHQALRRALERPESYPIAYRDYRRTLVRTFPYAVYFTATDALLVVFAILHGSQDRDALLDDRADDSAS